MEKFWKYKLDHMIFWTATVLFHMFTREYLLDKAGPLQFILEIVVRNGLLALAIYFTLHGLIPRYALRKKPILFIVLLIGVLCVYAGLKNIHDVYLYGYVLSEIGQRDFSGHTYYNFSIAIFYITFGIALQLSKEWYFQRETLRRIALEKINTELDYLKAQINPHFVFNSINTIYFQIDQGNVLARNSLAAFSELLRYQLYECNGDTIPIEKEITYLDNYVSLQKLRKDEHYRISFQTGDDVKGFFIAPLLIIPFIENAFKYVSHFPDDNEIRIELKRNGNKFALTVFNTRESNLNGVREEGIGLKNVKRRLELLYPQRHQLTIRQNARDFNVQLEIEIGGNTHEA